MSSAYLKIPIQELRDAATRFQQHSSELESTLAAMQQQIASLEGDWSGAAQQAFMSLMNEWGRDYNDMLRVLQRVKQLLDIAAEGFSENDTRFATVLNQIMGG